ncbi:methylated-DNA--[protein]-cysteine S-methyltransferase [Roseobacter sp. HKCCA0434]|uniref:bifunctional transcriptional activator/DNA repair enzyme AdaA n=1 Tax=Roseobacter sp. HKCCA0434 TaxID=3079297 RepID=UPI002905E097|nr:methylated-DNA--[protein]-cysteine S-methyltransferase [Roseobacter sp. HKCCA0434]
MTRQPDLFATTPHPLPADAETLYAALLARDPAWEGRAYVGVTSTGILCRLTCPARKPLRRNCTFFARVEEGRAAGFRPCLRCHPDATHAGADPLTDTLLATLDADPTRRWREEDIAALGHDPSTVRRAFRRRFGRTFLQIARRRRLEHAARTLGRGEPVIEAQLDAGYDSGSGFRAAYARATGAPPRADRHRAALPSTILETPIGPMMAVVDEASLLLLEFLDRPALPRELTALRAQTGRPCAEADSPLLSRVAEALDAYFDGKDRLGDLPVHQPGGAFGKLVRDTLRRVPPGTTTTYGRLAADLGRPTAARAVAQANGANRIAIVVPCHRVIGADGSLTGYGGGLWRKRWLIAHEHHMKETAP